MPIVSATRNVVVSSKHPLNCTWQVVVCVHRQMVADAHKGFVVFGRLHAWTGDNSPAQVGLRRKNTIGGLLRRTRSWLSNVQETWLTFAEQALSYTSARRSWPWPHSYDWTTTSPFTKFSPLFRSSLSTLSSWSGGVWKPTPCLSRR